jgi:hypothetical protein
VTSLIDFAKGWGEILPDLGNVAVTNPYIANCANRVLYLIQTNLKITIYSEVMLHVRGSSFFTLRIFC